MMGQKNQTTLTILKKTFDWTYSVYGNIDELLPVDAWEPLGKLT
jgi:hypothetical protein